MPAPPRRRASAAARRAGEPLQFDPLNKADRAKNGHMLLWTNWANPEDRPLWAKRDEWIEKFGEARADWMLSKSRNLCLYPNVYLMDQFSSQIRVLRPISVDKTEATIYCIAPKGEAPDARARRLRQYEDFFNATGMATPDDLAATVKLVEETGARIFATEADVRERDSLKSALRAGTEALGDRLDIVVANAGIAPMADAGAWQDVLDVNLTGVYHTVDVAMKPMIKFGNGGAMVLTSSVMGLVGVGTPIAGSVGYAAAKHGVVGLMRTYANLLAQFNIRVNSIHPAGVNTPMIDNEFTRSWLEGIAQEAQGGPNMSNALPVQTLEPEDIANAAYYLVSDAGRYVTGVALPVDAGYTNKR